MVHYNVRNFGAYKAQSIFLDAYVYANIKK